MKKSLESFQGFFRQTINYLNALQANNNKAWFEENRQIYTESLLSPMQSLVLELSPFMQSIDPLLETTPTVNKTISRIHRDTRFSKDKSPYRSSMWITFKRPAKEWQDAPAFSLNYILISTDTEWGITPHQSRRWIGSGH